MKPVALLAALVALAGPLAAQANPIPKSTPTQVLAFLVLKPTADRTQFMTVMPDEVRDTVRLYLSGKIAQWYSRGDGKGVVFLINCATVEEARALTDNLPLVKNSYATFDFMPVGPLMPLNMLVGPAPAH
jgi:hypothetical protein